VQQNQAHYAAPTPSPTDNTFLDDPLLMAFDALPANKMLHEAQVALLLGCKTCWLEEQTLTWSATAVRDARRSFGAVCG
jgi:hypothetical protein